MEIDDFRIENSTCGKFSGAHFDNRLTFDYHISELWKKLAKKLMPLQGSVNA